MTKRNPSLLTAAALFSLIETGCGGDNPAAVPRNSQPVVADISDATLEDGDSTTVRIQVEDEDEGDLHTINTTCEDQGVAQSSIEDETITIKARGVGVTTCTVYATDSSGQDNAQSASARFRVTVTEPPPVDLGACQVGMRVRPGESCNYPAGQYQVRFSVKPDGSSCRKSDKPITKEVLGIPVTIRGLEVCVNYDIRGDDVFDTPFSADQNSDGSWTIRDVP